MRQTEKQEKQEEELFTRAPVTKRDKQMERQMRKQLHGLRGLTDGFDLGMNMLLDGDKEIDGGSRLQASRMGRVEQWRTDRWVGGWRPPYLLPEPGYPPAPYLWLGCHAASNHRLPPCCSHSLGDGEAEPRVETIEGKRPTRQQANIRLSTHQQYNIATKCRFGPKTTL